jgi:hypothetical protein
MNVRVTSGLADASADPIDFVAGCVSRNRDAVSALMAILDAGEHRLFRGLIQDVIRYGVLAIKREVRHCRLTQLKGGEVGSRRANDEHKKFLVEHGNQIRAAVKALVDEHDSALYREWLLFGKLPLGEATRADLLTAAKNEENSSDGHLRNARFYRELASSVGDGAKLRECLPAALAAELRDKVYAVQS